MESEPSDVDSNRTREEVSHGVHVGCQATMPEIPELSYPKTSNNSSAVEAEQRAEHGRRVAMLLESRTRLLRGDPPEYHVHDSAGRFVGLFSDPTRALGLMRRRGIGSSVRYRSGVVFATLVPFVAEEVDARGNAWASIGVKGKWGSGDLGIQTTAWTTDIVDPRRFRR